MNRFLHIVCLESPTPADHGSAIDMLNRIKAFHKQDIKVYLHFFKCSHCDSTKELSKYCESIVSYEKKDTIDCLSLNAPYFVNSRCNKTLIDNLNNDNYPVLLEGLHTTGIINDINKNGRKISVRLHSEAAAYHRELARNTINPAKKTFYLAESLLAKKYMATLPNNCMYACVSNEDKTDMEQLGLSNVQFIPTFPTWQEVNSSTGMGSLCLFHGNLGDTKNEKAALWLLSNVFNKVRIPFIVAGKNPTRSLVKAAGLCQNTCLVANPSEAEMKDLIQKAHINILPCFNKKVTGSRLKLLHALYEGRHCITTPAMVAGTMLQDACHIGTTANAIAAIVSQLYYLPFEEEEVKLRKRLLGDTFNNDKNVFQFINYLW